MPVDPAVIGPTTFAVTQAVSSFNAFLPSFRDISQADPNNAGFVRDVRLGEFAAVMLALGIGGMASALTGSPVPTTIAVLTSAGLVMLYEYALRNGGEYAV
jgi:hypothetical protein